MSNPLIDDVTEKLAASIRSRLREKDDEIARLRAALEVIAADRLPGGSGPAEFARKALEDKSCSGE